MQFTDGNRIDLTLYPSAKLDQLGKDSLSLLLLDKDGIIAPFAPANESGYLPSPPTPKAFADCCVAEHFGFDYPHGDDERVRAYLRHVRFLPKDAQAMY